MKYIIHSKCIYHPTAQTTNPVISLNEHIGFQIKFWHKNSTKLLEDTKIWPGEVAAQIAFAEYKQISSHSHVLVPIFLSQNNRTTDPL